MKVIYRAIIKEERADEFLCALPASSGVPRTGDVIAFGCEPVVEVLNVSLNPVEEWIVHCTMTREQFNEIRRNMKKPRSRAQKWIDAVAARVLIGKQVVVE